VTWSYWCIIHSRLRDKFDLVIYYHNMVAT
jgi:hypothetical protein